MHRRQTFVRSSAHFVHHAAIVSLKPLSRSPPRRQSPHSNRPRQLSHGGSTFMPIMTSRHAVTADPRPNNRQ
ncbi:hypothetical protein TNCV_3760511 [Trichonephila clavipes]|nr:hypothetical protein TNCV_3760511 [Trichonephila clavipes]